MSEPAQKCKNKAFYKQNCTLKLFIAVKMTYSCSFSLGGNIDFLDFLQKKFYNTVYWRLRPKFLTSSNIASLFLSRLTQDWVLPLNPAESFPIPI